MATNEEIVFELDSIHVSMGELWLQRLKIFSELDRREVWAAEGCMDMAQWVAGRYGFSCYRAHRYIGAGHAISTLPLISRALSGGEDRGRSGRRALSLRHPGDRGGHPRLG